MKQIVIPSVFAASIMLSPDTLVLQGNIIGKAGLAGFAFIVLSALFYSNLVSTLSEYIFPASHTHSRSDGWVTMLLYYSKMAVTVFFSTGLLVSAGFIFNEVFVYWFPNFGLAFLALGVLVAIQFLGTKNILRFQIIFSVAALIGFAVLILAGIFQWGYIKTDVTEQLPENVGNLSISTLLPAVLLFLGIDIGILAGRHAGIDQRTVNTSIVVTVLVMAFLFVIWGILLIGTVTPVKLAQTSIPHILGAKAILGTEGRFMMGIVVIAGASAAVNGLFFAVQSHTAELIRAQKLPAWIKGTRRIVFALGLLTAGLMAGGLAGYRELETLIKASMVVWMISCSIPFMKKIVKARAGLKEMYSIKNKG